MKCPNDTDTDLQMSERQGVEIDYCPKCRGVWLDRGEINKIIERSVTEAPTAQADYDDYQSRGSGGHHSKGYDPRKRRKGWLGELFD
ncbi:MAG: zf-TFIIB domain-containing protein [Acidobacteriota bacterium]|nr:MAG: zf-TFIIB domain-containing protein [Acidobacteriota bacterium]